MQKSSGSAILIAVFLIAAVGSVAFGIGRLFMMESTIANIYESSTIAYYAAESGIEEGYLRYRYNKNTELPLTSAVPSTYDSTKVSKNELDASPPVQSNSTLSSFNPIASLRYYTLTMNYKSNYYGDENTVPGGGLNEQDLVSSSYPEVYIVPKDEAIKIDISDIVNASGTQDLKLLVLPQPTSSTSDFFAEVKLTGTTPLKNPTELKIALIADDGSVPVGLTAGSYLKSDLITNTNGVLPFNGLISNVRGTTSAPIFDKPNNKVELYIKPINAGAKIGIVPTNNTMIAGPYSTIKSTGYYGGVTRTLEARIDRQAGTVYDLFDYVLYKKP